MNAPTLGWRDVDLRGALEEAVGVPVHIERDAVACALAQMWMGQGLIEGADSFAYVTISDGVAFRRRENSSSSRLETVSNSYSISAI